MQKYAMGKVGYAMTMQKMKKPLLQQEKYR